jgi:transcriptional regulator with XRE-family HTH domain
MRTRLREFREARAMSQGDLARKAGFHLMTIARLEAGYGQPNRQALGKLAAALGVTVEQLLGPEAPAS